MADKTWTTEQLTHTDMNTYLTHTGGAWNTWTPQVLQGSTVFTSQTVLRANYSRAGRHIRGDCSIILDSIAGSSNNPVTVSYPVTPDSDYAGSGCAVGVGFLNDNSAGFNYPFVVTITGSTFLFLDTTAANGVYVGQSGSTFSAAIANADRISFSFQYEAASG